jgi:hypothetical protein
VRIAILEDELTRRWLARRYAERGKLGVAQVSGVGVRAELVVPA